MLLPAVHLTHDLHGLTHFVVDREEEDRGVHHARRLVVQRAEQLYEIARIGRERSEPTRELESRTKLIVIRGRLQHVPQPPGSPVVKLRLKRVPTSD